MITYSEKHPPSTPITPPAKKVPLTPTAAPVDQPAFRIQNQTNDQVNIRRLLKSVSMSSWLITMCKYATCAYWNSCSKFSFKVNLCSIIGKKKINERDVQWLMHTLPIFKFFFLVFVNLRSVQLIVVYLSLQNIAVSSSFC